MSPSAMPQQTIRLAGYPAIVRRIGNFESAKTSGDCVKTIANSLFAFAALLSFPGVAAAATLIVNCSTVSSQTELSASIVCPQFNLVATLQSVEITVQGPAGGAITGQLGMTSNSSASQSGTASTTSEFNVGALAGFTFVNPRFTATYSTGSQILSSGQNDNFAGLTGNGSGSTGTNTTSLGAYTGAGNFSIPVATATSYNFSFSGGNFGSSQVTNAAATAVVTYTYFAIPTLTTQASPTVVIGGTISDVATLTGGVNPTGNVTFNVYGPNDLACAGAIAFTSSVPVAGAAASSGSFTPLTAGTYTFTASYAGDLNNAPASSPCGAEGESVIVQQASPVVTTRASPGFGALIGATLSDIATLTSGFNPTGTIVFRLYGPSDATCSGTPAFTSAPIPVNGNGIYVSGPFTPTQAGTYSWIASYSGDVNNNPAADTCGLVLETVQITALIPTLNSLGLLLLILGLVTIGGIAMRRRSK